MQSFVSVSFTLLNKFKILPHQVFIHLCSFVAKQYLILELYQDLFIHSTVYVHFSQCMQLLLYTFVYRSFTGYIYLYSVSWMPGRVIVHHILYCYTILFILYYLYYVIFILYLIMLYTDIHILYIIYEVLNCSPKWLYHFVFPPSVTECSYFSTSLPEFSVVGVFDYQHFSKACCSISLLNLQFLNAM